MKILILTFYYEPDLCAGSFRNTSLVKMMLSKIDKDNDSIEVITTMPNRYSTFINEASPFEQQDNLTIHRVPLPEHNSGLGDQIFAFKAYFLGALRLARKNDYDIVYASSSRLFTAFLGAIIARYKTKPLYLDIRDIFVDTLHDVLKNKLLKLAILPILKLVESFTIRSARHLNMVSEGFREYFEYYKGSKSFYSNGIDDEFLEEEFQESLKEYQTGKPKIITYAGNIGEGQGLEKIIPATASKVGNDFLFRVIGDGGTRLKLENKLKELSVTNVELLPPVSRKELKKYYAQSDYLFLHLNDYEAFKKVLPSKIFEYGATNKTMIAGVGGYACTFVKENIEDLIIFDPGDANTFSEQLLLHKPEYKTRKAFVERFNRNNIMVKMTESILRLSGKKY
jgi:hypothetical protein